MLLSYNISKLQGLLKSFYTLAKVRIVVFNEEMEKIAQYPEYDCAFCAGIRKNPLAEEKCKESDRFACGKCRERGSIYSYTCHAGLTETVAPLKHGNIVTGYIIFGQVLQCDDAKKYWQAVWNRCQYYDVSHDELKKLYYKKTAMSSEQVLAAAQILEACAGYLWLQRVISLSEDDLPKRLDDYINENLNSDLSVNTLCKKFGISRSKLYTIAGEYYGKGIEQLTRELRISKAKKLLENGDFSVSEVASKAGYPDYNYFIKVFKKETGKTPKQYSLCHVSKNPK